MARVFGVHQLALNLGVREDDFERFLTDELYPQLHIIEEAGVQFYILKGERGDRAGRYLAIFEFDSLERFRWVTPAPGEFNAEYEQLIEPLQPVLEKLSTFVNWLDPTFTDYVVVGK